METLGQRYGKALYPAAHRVCGYRLRPFSLGHAFLFDRLLLHRLDCALAGGSKAPTVGELRLAVAICRRTHRAAVRFVQSTWGAFVLRYGMLRINFLTAPRGVFQFAHYLKAHQDHPEVWTEPDRKSTPAASPVLQQIKITLVSRLGYSAEAAMDCPLPVAVWDHFAFWESEGAMRVVGDKDAELREALGDPESELAKEMREFAAEMERKGKALSHA